MKISFLHSGLPKNSVSPVIFQPKEQEYKSFIFKNGTGFFAKHLDRIFFVTARHCLMKFHDKNDGMSDIASRIIIPFKLTDGKKDEKDYVKFKDIYTFKCENFNGKFLDLAILEVDVKRHSYEHGVLLKRSIKFPPSGLWFDDFFLEAKKNPDLFNIDLVFIGYPGQGTETQINYDEEDSSVITQKIITSGKLSDDSYIVNNYINGNEIYSHTHSIEKVIWSEDLGGFSGSPVFIKFRNKNGIQYAIVGMIVLGFDINVVDHLPGFKQWHNAEKQKIMQSSKSGDTNR